MKQFVESQRGKGYFTEYAIIMTWQMVKNDKGKIGSGDESIILLPACLMMRSIRRIEGLCYGTELILCGISKH